LSTGRTECENLTIVGGIFATLSYYILLFHYCGFTWAAADTGSQCYCYADSEKTCCATVF